MEAINEIVKFSQFKITSTSKNSELFCMISEAEERQINLDTHDLSNTGSRRDKEE